MLNYSHQDTFMVELMHQAKLGVHSNTPILKWNRYVCDQSQVHPEGTIKLHKEVAEMSMVPLLLHCLLSLTALLASFGVPYSQLTEEEQSQAWFIGVSVEYADTTLKWTATALQPLSGPSLKGSGEGNSSQRAELWAVLLGVHFAWKKWPDILIHGLWPWAWLDG